MSKSKLLLTAIAMTLSSSLYAQNHKFAGTVVDANGEPIIGATVNVKGSKENAITDIDGRFSISSDLARWRQRLPTTCSSRSTKTARRLTTSW